MQEPLNLPLMANNITEDDRRALIRFLEKDVILTQSEQVKLFEEEWSSWLGVKHSVFVNSGASANLVTMTVLKQLYGPGEVIVPTLTWVSDIASVIQCEFEPVFVDINPKHLGMDTEEVISKLGPKTKAVFLTHVMGYNALSDKLLHTLRDRKIPLIEDVCEAHGASFKKQKLGSFGLISNFSYYYAHHMSTIEGGMVCTNDEKIYQMARMVRSHGMVRESSSSELRTAYAKENSELHPEFIFAFPAYNVRSTELNAILGRNQLKRLDENNKNRRRNFETFLKNLDSNKFQTNFEIAGAVNYAFTLVLKEPNMALCQALMNRMREEKIEFRRGMSGGGNQLRQPYLRDLMPTKSYLQYPHVEHVHFFGFYLGNYPELSEKKILRLCEILNSAAVGK